jgi:CheY-like chemotaxis protein/HPt (histidine-containing phosphotransfer) domain-containing protein
VGSTFRFTAQFEALPENIHGKPIRPAGGDAANCVTPRETPPAAGSEDGREKEPVQPARILIADDSPDNRLLVQVYLKASPYELTFEQDGKGAAERFAASDFDLILMDIRMPVMDGLAATRAIRELERERCSDAIPIIALTARAGLRDIEDTLAAGCNAHMSKPVSKLDLVGAIEKYRRRPNPAESEPRGSRNTIGLEMPSGLEDIVPAYLATRKREVSEMIALLAASDFERLSILGHNLKGTARGYGFPDLVRMGGALEDSANQRNCATLRGQMTELGEYLDRVRLIAKG